MTIAVGWDVKPQTIQTNTQKIDIDESPKPKIKPSLFIYLGMYTGVSLRGGRGDFPTLLMHVSPATFDKFV